MRDRSSSRLPRNAVSPTTKSGSRVKTCEAAPSIGTGSMISTRNFASSLRKPATSLTTLALVTTSPVSGWRWPRSSAIICSPTKLLKVDVAGVARVMHHGLATLTVSNSSSTDVQLSAIAARTARPTPCAGMAIETDPDAIGASRRVIADTGGQVGRGATSESPSIWKTRPTQRADRDPSGVIAITHPQPPTCVLRPFAYRSPLYSFRPRVGLERRPARLAAGVVADLAGEGVDLGVEVVEAVQGDRLERHRQLGLPNSWVPWWLTIMCLSRRSSSCGNGSPVRSATFATFSRSISTPITRWPTSWPSSV